MKDFDLPVPAEARPALAVAALEVLTKDLVIRVADWTIPCGRCVAMIGPNGAGKTTIIEALLGLRKIGTLRGTLLGHEIAAWGHRPILRQRLGVQLQRTSLPFGMRIIEIVALHRGLYRRSAPAIHDALGIGPLAHKVYERLSRGERQRVELFLAFAHAPELAFLDEPFTGLDQQYALAAADIVRDLVKSGSTVVMACHSAAELSLADIAAWINRGVLKISMAPDLMRKELLGDFRLHVSFTHVTAAQAFRNRLQTQVSPQFCRVFSPTEYALFGGEAFVQFARSLVDDSALTSLEFGRTGWSDLLYRCAQGDAHA